VLQERLLPKHRPSDADLLTALLNVNRFLDQTLDAKLYRLSFNPWQLATDPSLQPGVALTLKDGTFATSGSQAKCAVALTTQPLAKEKTGLDTILPTHRAEHVRTMLSVPGQVDVALGELEVVAGVPAGMTGCVDPGSGATHMVTEVIRAKTVFLRVRDASAAVQYPEEERLSAAASYPIKIAATTRPEWSAVIQEPVVLGFKAQPITGGSTASSEITASVPLSDLLRRRFEYLAVPVTGWEPVIAVPALELGVGSNLRTIQSRIDPTVTISPLQRSAAQTTASSAAVSIQPPPRRVTEEARGAEGQRIRTLINYPKNPPDTTGVVIAVAEVSKSVDRDHPGFRREDGSNVWSKEREDGSGITVEPSSAQPAPGDQEERDFKQADDHGTHVAGLLAGVGVPPGLAQQAQLFLLPAEEEAHKIRSRLEFAAKIPASVLNYSQIMWTSPEAIEQVGGGIDLLANNLLVVAATASNRGGQLLNQPSMLPIGYADGPNVIGVSAADERRQLLSGVSDYGKRYVQLLAYGKDVLGLAKKGAYARASGASQAAPQVAGAAALLVAQGKTNPAQIKARLIAAADWLPDYEEKVWGGFLNVGRASGNLLSNVLTRRNLQGMKVVASVSFAPGEKLQLRRSIDYRPDAVTPTQATSDGAIEWGRILRLVRQTWLPQNNRDRDSYRMVYLSEDGEVRIRKNVELQPNQEFVPQRCAPLLDADPTVAPAEPPPSAGHCDPVRVENIDDYISKFPEQTNITFRRSPQQ
jgi:subtilisin family serine protease